MSDIVFKSKGALLEFIANNLTNLSASTNVSASAFYGDGANLTNVAGAGGAPTDAQYLTLATNTNLSAERVLTAGSNISFVDGGADGALTVTGLAPASGLVTGSGTPAVNELAVWTNSTTIEGNAKLTFDGNVLSVAGDNAKLIIEETDGTDYRVVIDPSAGPQVQFGDDTSDAEYMTIGAYSNLNNIDTEDRDFHLYGSTTTTGFYFDESEGKFGIRTDTPEHLLTVATDVASEAVSSVTQYNNSTAVDGPNILLQRARGTMASPSINRHRGSPNLTNIKPC